MSSIKYTKTSDKTVSVKGYATPPTGSLIIPNQVNHKGVLFDVTGICDEAFNGCDKITEVQLPFSIKSIGEKAFAGCTRLEKINIPEGIIEIGKSAFAWSGIKSINIPDSLFIIENYAFDGCNKLKSIYATRHNPLNIEENVFDEETINSATIYVQTGDLKNYLEADIWKRFNIVNQTKDSGTITSNDIDDEDNDEEDNVFIHDNLAFKIKADNTVSVTSCSPEQDGTLIIPKTINDEGTIYRVTEIEKDAFRECCYINKIVIPDSIIYIEFGVFAMCDDLEAIDVSINNEGMSSVDGVLMDKSMSILVAYPCGKKGATYHIPSTITTIGHISFARNKNLKSVTMTNSVTDIGIQSFFECEELNWISLSDNLERIGAGAFANCQNLKKIYAMSIKPAITNESFSDYTKTDTILYVRENAFDNYKKEQEWGSFQRLKKCENIILNDILYTILSPITASVNRSNPGNKGKITIPEYVEDAKGNKYQIVTIEYEAFSNNEDITSITMPDSIQSIDYRAFESCHKLKSIKLSESLESIGNYCFSDCQALKTITLPNKVKVIGHHLFSDDTSLKEINVEEDSVLLKSENGILYTNSNVLVAYPAGKKDKEFILTQDVEDITEEAFFSCSNLENIHVEEKNEQFSSINGILYNKDISKLLLLPSKNKATSYEMPASVTEMSAWAFTNCRNLKKIELSDNLTTISFAAFARCVNLESINIPSRIKDIGDNAFSECIRLRTINIPQNIKRIGKYSFAMCRSLVYVDIPENVEEIEDGAFYSCTNLRFINLPRNLKKIGSKAFKETFRITEEEKNDNNAFNFRQIMSFCKDTPDIKEDTFDQDVFDNTTLVVWSEDRTVRNNFEWGEYWENFKQKEFTNDDIYNIIPQEGWKNFLDNVYPKTDLKWIKSFSKNNINYHTNSYTTISISHCKDNSDIIVLPDVIEKDNKVYTLTKIDDNAFANNSAEHFLFPNSVEFIGNKAFDGCHNIKNINLNEGVKEIKDEAFANCSQLTNLTLPSTTKSLGAGVCSNCVNLLSITIPKDVKRIESNAFLNCKSIKNVKFNTILTTICHNAFDGCENIEILELPKEIESIEAEAFKNCKNLKYIYIGSYLIDIDKTAFSGCENIELIWIDEFSTLTKKTFESSNANFKIKKIQ